MYKYASVCDKSAVYEQMERDMLFCQIIIETNDKDELKDTLHFVFGKYENIDSVSLTYTFQWQKNSYTTSMGKEMTKYRLVNIE